MRTLAAKLLANTAVVFLITLYFEHVEHFHISRFTNHLRHFIINESCYVLLLIFYRVLLNYVMFMSNSNEPIKVAHLQKLTIQSMLNGAFVIEMVNNSFSKMYKNFGCWIKRRAF